MADGSSMTSTGLAAETVVVSVLLAGGVLLFTLRRLMRSRPSFRVATPLTVAFALRLIAIAGVASTGLQGSLRGGDETTFMGFARELAASPFGHGFLPHGHYPLHTVVFALQLKLGGFSEGAIRVTQVGIALLGVLLIVAAAHDLAGPRPARALAWILAFEPASIFFNSALHKEPLMVFASGMMVFGGTKVWQRLDYSGIVYMAIGGLMAVETRPYAGWFLISAGVLVILHGSLRRLDRPFRAMPLVYAVVIAGFIAAPALVQVTSSKSLTTLQQSQDANTDPGAKAASTGANGNNLALERVDYSNRGAVLSNLPNRMLDVVFKPYPWQVANASQQLGAVGTLFAMGGLMLLIGSVWRRRGHVLQHVGPILYPMLFLLMAYALSAGNAGTGFRYRTHIVLLGVAMLAVLRWPEPHLGPTSEDARARAAPPQPEAARRLPSPGWSTRASDRI